MPQDATVIADPSSATPPKVPAEVTTGLPDLASQSPQERREWLAKGTPFTSPKAADSAPAPPNTEDPAPSPDAKAPKESSAPAEKPGETVAAPEVASKQGKKGNAQQRSQELNTDIQQLLERRHQLKTEVEALEKGAKKPAESPAAEAPKPAEAKVETEKDGRPKRPVAPKLGDFATYDEYETAVQAYAAEFEKYEELRDAWLMGETRKTVEKELTAKQQKEADKKAWDGVVKEHGAEFPEWANVVIAATPEGLQLAIAALDDWGGVTKHLATNPDDLKALAEKFKANPYAAVAELGKIEASLATAKAADPATPAQPKLTKAPPPPTDIAARNAAPVDARKAAIEAGDFTTFQAMENAREIAARKRA